MRKGELLNVTWRDIDFEKQLVLVTAKTDTELTWHWDIKDHDERTLPLTDELTDILTELQVSSAEGCPYVFVPAARHKAILWMRSKNNWDSIKTRENLNSAFFHPFSGVTAKGRDSQGRYVSRPSKYRPVGMVQ